MLSYRFTPKFLKRKLFFPLSQDSRIIEDKPKHNFDNKNFKNIVNKELKPLLLQLGFNGQDYFYFRLSNKNNIETITLGTSPYGKAICVNVEIKKYNGDFINIDIEEIKNLESISPTSLEWTRLSPDKKDCWWWFRATEVENKNVLLEIYNLIILEAEKYFEKYNK
jgi:hypothetical protein